MPMRLGCQGERSVVCLRGCQGERSVVCLRGSAVKVRGLLCAYEARLSR